MKLMNYRRWKMLTELIDVYISVSTQNEEGLPSEAMDAVREVEAVVLYQGKEVISAVS